MDPRPLGRLWQAARDRWARAQGYGAERWLVAALTVDVVALAVVAILVWGRPALPSSEFRHRPGAAVAARARHSHRSAAAHFQPASLPRTGAP